MQPTAEDEPMLSFFEDSGAAFGRVCAITKASSAFLFLLALSNAVLIVYGCSRWSGGSGVVLSGGASESSGPRRRVAMPGEIESSYHPRVPVRALRKASASSRVTAKEQNILKNTGLCPQGYEWKREGSGYRCEGGSHYVSSLPRA